MKTTIYELLGMVKDGKAPKKIKYKDFIYEFDGLYGDYFNKSLNRYLFVYITSEETLKLAFLLNVEVEIIENNGDIKEITLDDWAEITYTEDWKLLTHDFNLNANTFVDKINELIREVNKLKK